MDKSTKGKKSLLPAPRCVDGGLEPYIRASTQASGVPLQVEDAGTVAALVTLVRSTLKRAK